MDLTNRVTQLEDEIKVLKNEVLAVLLDVKENLLTRENPFSQQSAQNNSGQPVININQTLPGHDNKTESGNVSSNQPGQSSRQSTQTENDSQDNGNGHVHQGSKNNGDGHSDESAPEAPAGNGNRNNLETLLDGRERTAPSNGHDGQLMAQQFPGQASNVRKDPENGNAEHNETGNSIELSTLLGLMKWVETTTGQLGSENTMMILDVTEMMGKIPDNLKLTLDKLIPHNGHIESLQQVSPRIYLNCLKELAKLLGQTNVGDFVSVHVVTHGLSVMAGEKNMDKAIITVLLIVCGVVATMTIFNEVLPAINQSQGAIAAAASDASNRMTSGIKIIQAGLNGDRVTLWVKNIGSSTIVSIENSDVLFGLEGNPALIEFGGAAPPNWNFEITGDHDSWSPSVTVCITINLATQPAAGTYSVRVVIPNGVSDETSFSAG